MDDPFEKEHIEICKVELQAHGAGAAAAKINAYLKELDDIQLNIAFTGESGSGKSTFVNAFRGFDNTDERAAPTGYKETTMEVLSYPHPNFPNVTLWDLPGIGTDNFPADKYLQHVGFERFDFFIIVSADRFRENDVMVAKAIRDMKKKFYFVHSKIDQDISNTRRSRREFNEEKTLAEIRNDCLQGLEKHQFESPHVFLVSSFDLQLYDFHLLQETLERELPAHKRDTLLLALPNFNLAIIKKKKEALQSKVKYFAALSALGAAVPVPGLSVAVDLPMLVTKAIQYRNAFGLDPKSLQSLAVSARVPLDDLTAEMKSPLAVKAISREVVLNLLQVSTLHVALMAAEEGLRFIPLFGIPIASSLSFACTYRALTTFLNTLAEDAQRVFTKALGLHSSV